MTSPKRYKKCTVQYPENSDWDPSSNGTGTVKRRRSSCPENSTQVSARCHETIFEDDTPSDSGSTTSKSINDTDKSDSLVEVEQRISSLINENRSSKSNSESSDVDIAIEDILSNPNDESLSISPGSLVINNEIFSCDTSDTFARNETHENTEDVIHCRNNLSDKNKNKERKLKSPTPIRKFNKPLEIIRGNSKQTKYVTKVDENARSVLPIYKCTVDTPQLELGTNLQKKKGVSKLRLPFSPAKNMDKTKLHFFQNKSTSQDNKPSELLSSPVRRTISNEYVRLKFAPDTVVRRTIDGKPAPKITPKIQSIIPESPVDAEDPFLNLSPNKKYTVTVNNTVRCDKDNYVIFDPDTGFEPDETARSSRATAKTSGAEKSKIPLKSPVREKSGIPPRQSLNVSDTDSGILSPTSPVETSADEACGYVNASVFSAKARRISELDITILDPVLAKKAADQIKRNQSPCTSLTAPRSEGKKREAGMEKMDS
ncbi:hypothetical protein EVAR_58020_1 [Eumeta japonica]|uniref:Uncharacterized protein n=1 Tax=Eumeta variegata TaxID=151549 RepID=A0A4C2A509_EUMVA|nr:hypothetical protein EVAR_58020_1 [Eumeta japonica]